MVAPDIVTPTLGETIQVRDELQFVIVKLPVAEAHVGCVTEPKSGVGIAAGSVTVAVAVAGHVPLLSTVTL